MDKEKKIAVQFIRFKHPYQSHEIEEIDPDIGAIVSISIIFDERTCYYECLALQPTGWNITKKLKRMGGIKNYIH